jgi:hypothetical protein
MKKSVFVLIIFVAALFATEKVSAQFVLGIKLGYTGSKLNTNIDSIKSSLASGFHLGAFARIGKRVYLQPEFYYNLSGASFEDVATGDWKQNITVGSLDIPVLVGFDIIKSKIFKWRIMAGPEVSFLVNSKVKDVGSITGPIKTSDMNTTGWFIQAGTGIDVLIFTLDVRYQAGLNSLINDVTANDGTVYPVNSQANMFVVSLGIKIL